MKPAARVGRFFCVLLAMLAANEASGQPAIPEFPPRPRIPEAISFFAPLVFPKVLQDVWQLREYVRGDEFAQFRKQFGDVYAVDALFDKAMRLAWNNSYEALLISFLATLDHRRVGFRLPVIGSLLWAPLTSEFEDEFEARIEALPKRLFPDTPVEGDRDKLQHFFGSALLSHLLESEDAADRVGLFVEWGEDAFIVGGVLDARDIQANRRGQRFGLWLLSDDETRPSRFFSRPLTLDTTATLKENAVQ